MMTITLAKESHVESVSESMNGAFLISLPGDFVSSGQDIPSREDIDMRLSYLKDCSAAIGKAIGMHQ